MDSPKVLTTTRPTFTPGPWKIGGRKTINRDHPDKSMQVTVARADSPATARLIAAAPELYEALQHIAYEPLGHAEATYEEALAIATNIARAALAKADGRCKADGR